MYVFEKPYQATTLEYPLGLPPAYDEACSECDDASSVASSFDYADEADLDADLLPSYPKLTDYSVSYPSAVESAFADTEETESLEAAVESAFADTEETESLEDKVERFFQENNTLLISTLCAAVGCLFFAAILGSTFLFGAAAMAASIFAATAFTGVLQGVDFSEEEQPYAEQQVYFSGVEPASYSDAELAFEEQVYELEYV